MQLCLSNNSPRTVILHSLTLNSAMARKNRVMVSVTYFKACVDRNNEEYHDQPVTCRGRYITVSGVVKMVDGGVGHCVVVGDTVIAFSNILRIESNHAVEGIDSCSGIFNVAWEGDAP